MSDVKRIDKVASGIVLRARGVWFHQGEPFENPKIIEFFHRAIRRDENGEYYLYNHYEGRTEQVYFTVEDTAYFVLAIPADLDQGSLLAVLNTGAREPLDLGSLEINAEGVVYCLVLDGDRARILPRALQDLLDHVPIEEREPGAFYLQHQGQSLPIRKR